MMYYGKSTLRIAPPISITKENVDRAVEIIDRAIQDVERGKVSDEVISRFSSWK